MLAPQPGTGGDAPAADRARRLRAIMAAALLIAAVAGLAGWQYQARRSQQLLMGDALNATVARGLYGPEQSAYYGGRSFRWTQPTGTSLRFWATSPAEYPLLSLWLSLPMDRQPVSLETGSLQTTLPVDNNIRRYLLLLPDRPLDRLTVRLTSPPYRSTDPRKLGVVLWNVRLEQSVGAPVTGLFAELITFPQLPLAVLLLGLSDGRRRLQTAIAVAAATLALIMAGAYIPAHPLFVANVAFCIAVVLLLGRLAARLPWLAPANERAAVVLLGFCFTLIFLCSYRPVIYSDGIGYFSYLRSLVLDGDLDLANEYATLYSKMQEITPVAATGKMPNPWSIGPALLWAPFYIATHRVVSLAGGPWAADGYGEPYVVAATLVSALAAFVVLITSYRISRRFCSPQAAALAALTILTGSTLWYYSMYMGGFAHALSAATSAAFLLAWLRLEERQNTGRWLVFGFTVGLMTLIYWTCALLLLGPAVTFLRRLLLALWARDNRQLARLAGGAALAAVIALMTFSPQLIAWQVIYGNPLTKPPATPYLTLQSHWLEMLFAPYGLLIWTPAMFLGLCGLFLLWRRDRWLMAGLLLSFGAYFVYNSLLSDWHGSGAFGLRRITSLAPWCTLGLALLYRQLIESGRRSLMMTIGMAAGFWMLMLMISDQFHYIADITPQGLAKLPPGKILHFFALMPVWNLPAFLNTSYLAQALIGEESIVVALAALIIVSVVIGSTWLWAGRWNSPDFPAPER